MNPTAALGWAIIAFFAVTGVINCAGSQGIRDGFKRWGYPRYMHLITGGLELIAAVLMAFAELRWLGLALGFCVIVAALATVLYRREYAHAIPPATTLATMIVWGYLLAR